MFLLTTTTRHGLNQRLFNHASAAIVAAQTFVGEHNAIDGCSSEPRVFHRPNGGFHTIRSTSFGPREATVTPIDAPQD